MRLINKHHYPNQMFKRFILFVVFGVHAVHVFGNPRADELRKSMYQSPDTLRAGILLSIAKLYQYENADSCLYYAQSASDMGYRTRQYLAVIDAQTLMSQIALDKKDYAKATDHRRTIRDLTVRERLWDLAMENYNAMAQTWLLRNNYAEAVEELKRGLEIAVNRSNLEMTKYYYLALIDSYRKLRNIEAVNNYYLLLMEVNQTIEAQAYNSRINALQTERETLIADAEDARNWRKQQQTVSKVLNLLVLVWAILLSAAFVTAYLWFQYRYKPGIAKSQKEMSDKAKRFDSLLKNQESAFGFLTNYVYANINALSESISLFPTIRGKKNVAADSSLSRIKKDIDALYSFFQNFTLLLQIQSEQLEIEFSTVNIAQLATNLFVDFDDLATAKKIHLNNEVQNNTFAIADERWIDTVLRNIMSNAIKYAPKETGNITVGTKIGTRVETAEGAAEDAGFIEVWVTDDGIGLTSEQVGILFDLNENLTLTAGFESKGYGVGLAVCRSVIEKLHGRIWAETKPGEGFCMRFNLPRAMDTEVKTLSLPENTQETISTEFISDNPLLLSE